MSGVLRELMASKTRVKGAVPGRDERKAHSWELLRCCKTGEDAACLRFYRHKGRGAQRVEGVKLSGDQAVDREGCSLRLWAFPVHVMGSLVVEEHPKTTPVHGLFLLPSSPHLDSSMCPPAS